MPDILESLLSRAHDGITEYDYNGIKTPCILLDKKRFDHILQNMNGHRLSLDVDLDVLQDGLGHVFVDVVLSFSKNRFVEKILVNAQESLRFFELMAETTILTLSPPNPELHRDILIMIQLPSKDRLFGALMDIKRGLQA